MHEKPHVQGTLEGDQDFGGAWEVLGSSTVQAAHYLGFILIPLGAFLVGVFQYDLLHAGYLAQLLVYFLGSTARLEPPLETAVVPLRQVIILQVHILWVPGPNCMQCFGMHTMFISSSSRGKRCWLKNTIINCPSHAISHPSRMRRGEPFSLLYSR